MTPEQRQRITNMTDRVNKLEKMAAGRIIDQQLVGNIVGDIRWLLRIVDSQISPPMGEKKKDSQELVKLKTELDQTKSRLEKLEMKNSTLIHYHDKAEGILFNVASLLGVEYPNEIIDALKNTLGVNDPFERLEEEEYDQDE
jgi:hypothetical protein